MISSLCLVIGLLSCQDNGNIRVWAGSHGYNVAVNKQARVSGVLYPHYAKNAVDGDTDITSKTGRCAMALESRDGEIWFEVDLGQRYRLGNIRILIDPKFGVGQFGFRDVTLEVFEKTSEPRNKETCTRYMGPATGGWLDLSCNDAVTGRYLRITKLRIKKDHLHLCEVEVYQRKDLLLTRIPHTQGRSYSRDLLVTSLVQCASVCRETRGCQGFNTYRTGSDHTCGCQIIVSKSLVKTSLNDSYSYFSVILE